MSSPSAINRNNYATPNTPIASSKQPKKKITASPSLVSPMGKSRPEAGLAAAGRSIVEEHIPVMTRRPSQSMDTMHSATPSKNLFSPILRFADGTNTVVEAEAEVEPSTPKKESTVPPVPSQVNLTPIMSSKQNSTESKTMASPANSNLNLSPGHTPSSATITPVTPVVQVSTVPAPVTPTVQAPTQTAAADDHEDDEDVFNPYLFIANLPVHNSLSNKIRICLPPQNSANRQMITLALDLDETLVHCSTEPIPNPDHIFPVSFNDVLYQVYVRKRPYLDHFLESVYRHFEMVVFTASQKVYADALLDLIDPDKKFVHHRLFREACVFVQGNYLKDLTVLGRDLSKTILVDNSPHTYGFHIDNGIPIESWFDDPEDGELLKLADFLKRLIDNNTTDVRPVIREHFKTYQLVQQAKMGYPVVLTAPPF